MANQLPPGRELDKLVAEALGWVPWLEERGGYLHIVFQRPGDQEPWTRYRLDAREREMLRYRQIEWSGIDWSEHVVHGLANFSTDIAAAMGGGGPWQALPDGATLTKAHEYSDGQAVCACPWNNGKQPIGRGTDEAHAICLAFLAWKEAEDG